MISELIGENYNKFFLKTYRYLVGSASTALFVYLKYKEINKSKILIPSNICHSIPLTIKFSGNIPLFYDVDINTGNPDTNSIIETLAYEKVAAILLPNMYGNIYKDREKIIKVLKDKNILIIDDYAASFGITLDNLHSEGDATIFSFGKNKHIDLGVGGLLATNEKIDIKSIINNINNNYEDSYYKIQLFDSLYKPIFYSKFYYQLLPLLDKVIDFFKDSYVFQFYWNYELVEKLDKELDTFEKNKDISLKKIDYLNHKINFNNTIYSKYEFAKGSNPWRYNIFINDITIKEEIISESLKKNLLISKWYPPIESLFGQLSFHNSICFSNRILNLNHIKSSWEDLDIFINILNNVGEKFEK